MPSAVDTESLAVVLVPWLPDSSDALAEAPAPGAASGIPGAAPVAGMVAPEAAAVPSLGCSDDLLLWSVPVDFPRPLPRSARFAGMLGTVWELC